MYTSFYSKHSSSHKGGAKSRTSDIISMSGLEVNVRPVLEYNAKLINGKLIVIF